MNLIRSINNNDDNYPFLLFIKNHKNTYLSILCVVMSFIATALLHASPSISIIDVCSLISIYVIDLTVYSHSTMMSSSALTADNKMRCWDDNDYHTYLVIKIDQWKMTVIILALFWMLLFQGQQFQYRIIIIFDQSRTTIRDDYSY